MSAEVRPFQTHHVVQLLAHENGSSMPSDHATAAFAIAAAIGVFLHRGWGVVLAVAAAAIGFARIWSGLHYPGDIIAAALIAMVVTAVVWWGDQLLRRSTALTAL
jgi:undecaprenyl-diphosphatase